MAGRGQRGLIATVVLGLVAAGSSALAEPVPLPPPAPLPRTGGAPVPPASVPSTQSTRPAPPAAVPSPQTARPGAPTQSAPLWLPPFFGGQAESKTTTAFDPAQRALVDKVSAYLSNMRVLSGNFAQVGPDGRQSKGQFYMQKPGRVRFEYDPPNPIEIVANGSDVVVRDRKLNTQDPYSLSQTPLRFLLTDRIDLLKDTNVIGVYADDLFVTVVIEEKQALVGTSRLMMMFDTKTLVLKQWVITDPQGYDTTIAISNLDTKRQPDPSLFHIDLTRYDR